MNKILFLISVLIILSGCGKKSTPVYTSMHVDKKHLTIS